MTPLARGTIYVDALKPCVTSARWRHAYSCHMFCLPGDEDQLHRLAFEIGLRREWYQERPGQMPHYDLSPGARVRAREHGAQEASREQTVEAMQTWRDHSASFFGRLKEQLQSA